MLCLSRSFRLAAAAPCLLLMSCAPVQQLQTAAAVGSSFLGSSNPPAQASLSPAALRQLQSRDFQTSRATAFSSAVTVLLDSGYRVLTADQASGLITAAASSNSRLRLDTAGIARSNETPMASVFVEERSAGTVRIRVSFSVGKLVSGQLGEHGETAVLDAGLYGNFFAQIDQEVIARRPPEDVPTVVIVPVPLPVPQAAGPEPVLAPAPEPEFAPEVPPVAPIEI